MQCKSPKSGPNCCKQTPSSAVSRLRASLKITCRIFESMLTYHSVESKGTMIHLLKAGSKPVAHEYKRRIVPIAASLLEFQADQQKFEMQANDKGKASKKKKEEAPKQQKQE